MRPILRTIARDAAGLARVCGPWVAARWLACIARRARTCLKQGKLSPADVAMGDGPFTIRRGRCRARASGPNVIGGIREMWVRDNYLGGDFLRIAPNDVVVDLGANRGLFTLMALAHGPGVSVVAVEAGEWLCKILADNLALNGWSNRARLCRRFIGGMTSYQQTALQNPEYASASLIDEQSFLRTHQLDRIDFLKCDIEGSEFELLRSDSALLAQARQVAVEVHDFAGDRRAFARMLADAGFEVRVHKDDPQCCTLHARRRQEAALVVPPAAHATIQATGD